VPGAVAISHRQESEDKRPTDNPHPKPAVECHGAREKKEETDDASSEKTATEPDALLSEIWLRSVFY
jgi:hypothetical protein